MTKKQERNLWETILLVKSMTDFCTEKLDDLSRSFGWYEEKPVAKKPAKGTDGNVLYPDWHRTWGGRK